MTTYPDHPPAPDSGATVGPPLDGDGTRDVWVSRHARTGANELGLMQGWADYELSDSGRVDVEAARDWWAERPITWVVSSPVRRAMETAELLFGRVDELDSAWIEQAMPQLIGMESAEAAGLYPELLHPDGWSKREAPSSGTLEHIDTVAARASAALQRLAARPVGTHTAVVTHGAVLVSLLRAAGYDASTVGNLAVGQFAVSSSGSWSLVDVHHPV